MKKTAQVKTSKKAAQAAYQIERETWGIQDSLKRAADKLGITVAELTKLIGFREAS